MPSILQERLIQDKNSVRQCDLLRNLLGVDADMSLFTVKYRFHPYIPQLIVLKSKSRPAHPVSLCISCLRSTPATFLEATFVSRLYLGLTKLQPVTWIRDRA